MRKSLIIATLLSGLLFYSCGSTSSDSPTQFQVTLSSLPAEGGSVSPANGEYDEGKMLEISATPNDGWRFIEWVGDYSGTESTTSITVDGDKAIKATFKKKKYNLTVMTDGEGTVSEEVIQPTVIDSTEYDNGSTVKLTATPETGWEFVEWQGDLTGSTNPETITVDSPKEVTAVFEKQSFTLTINTTGQGTVAKKPDQSTYEYGSVVELTANPDNDWDFEEWQGDVTGTDNPVQLTVDEAKDVTAVFVEQSKNLFYLADNGVTIKCPEAAVGDSGIVNGVTYTKRSADQIYVNNANEVAATTCTSGIRDMYKLFYRATDFNADISSWDVSSVRDMSRMFDLTYDFNADLSSWDVSHVTNMYKMFWQAYSFNGNISSWDVGNVTNMHEMFAFAIVFNGDISSWDVSSVTNMGRMFYQAEVFNGDISSWDVSGVTTLRATFNGAEAFNADLSNWDVGSVTSIEAMFAGATAFNSDLNSWNVSNVKFMSATFSGATSFNGDISSWDVSNVGSMRGMFGGAESFNRDIDSWDVSSVNDMESMFHGATAFNQNLNGWDVSSVTDMEAMFKGAESFNGSVSDWDVSYVGHMDVMFYGATVFDKDLSRWCVSQFEHQIPSGFGRESALTSDHLPVWGTCPGGN